MGTHTASAREGGAGWGSGEESAVGSGTCHGGKAAKGSHCQRMAG